MNQLLMAFRKTHVLLVLFCSFMVACIQKEINQNAIPQWHANVEDEKQIAYITYGQDSNAEKWFVYNDNGDIISQNALIDTIFYEYAKNKIIKKYRNANNWLSKIEYLINDHGKITNSTIFDEDNLVISTYQFVYNVEGYLINTIQLVSDTKLKYVHDLKYKDGNLVEIITNSTDGNVSSKYVFEYYKDIPNNVNLFLDGLYDDVFPNERLGRKNLNRLKQSANIAENGDTLSILSYTYNKKDEKDKLEFIQKDILNDNETLVTYHFNKIK